MIEHTLFLPIFTAAIDEKYFRATNSISYKCWHLQLKFDNLLKLLRLTLGPREVAEVARAQAKKIQKFWNLPFLSYKNIMHLKIEQLSFRFEIKLEDLFMKK